MAYDFRVGHGFDVHRFRRGRKLILGGVEIPHDLGLLGHSDADVVLHALMNAILGALGKGDIGLHFPESDVRYEGIASSKLLQKIFQLMRQNGYALVNAGVTIVAQKPRLAPYYSSMSENIATVLKVGPCDINIGAATTEKLGWIGEGKGVAAFAVVLLRKQRVPKRRYVDKNKFL